MNPTPAQLKVLRKVEGGPVLCQQLHPVAAEACRRKGWIGYLHGADFYFEYSHAGITPEGRRALKGGG